MSQIIKNIKPVFEEAVSPFLDFLRKAGISPNTLTLSGVLFVIAGSFFIYQGDFFKGALLLIAGNLCDALDGALARKTGDESSFGAFLDSIIDRVSDFLPVVAVGFCFMEEPIFFLAVYTALVSFLVSYARARAEGLGIDCKVGIMERAERSVVFILSLLFDFVIIGLFIIAAGATITVAQRIWCVYKSAD